MNIGSIIIENFIFFILEVIFCLVLIKISLIIMVFKILRIFVSILAKVSQILLIGVIINYRDLFLIKIILRI
jgi:hypothetical protein